MSKQSELDEAILSSRQPTYANGNNDAPLAGWEELHISTLKQAITDWHNKQTEALLNELLVDVSSPNANIDQAEMIELINLYVNKLKESSNA